MGKLKTGFKGNSARLIRLQMDHEDIVRVTDKVLAAIVNAILGIADSTRALSKIEFSAVLTQAAFAAIYSSVKQQVEDGVDDAGIVSTLVEQGLDRGVAAKLAKDFRRGHLETVAMQRLKDGVDSAEIRSSLVEQGLDQDSAASVAANLAIQTCMESEARQASGRRNMYFGALWCIGGVIVTVVSYSAALSGGTYVLVAWGQSLLVSSNS